MAQINHLSILQGINLFKKEYLFTKETQATRRSYNRSLDLFTIFLMLDGLKPPGNEINIPLTINAEKILLRDAGVDNINIRLSISEEDTYLAESVLPESLANVRLIDLQPSVYPQFLAWLNSPYRRNGKGLSQVTIKSYQAGIRAVLGFWRVRRLLSFMSEEQEDLLKHSSVTSKKLIDDPARRSKMVPKEFGERMVYAVYKLPLPEMKPGIREIKLERLAVLRARALILVLYSSGQRISDVTNLNRDDLFEAFSGNLIIKENIKTGRKVHFFLGNKTIHSIEEYLKERNDSSPFIFIQHGRWGTAPKGTAPHFFTRKDYRRGYGARLSTKTARDIVHEVATKAGFVRKGKAIGGAHITPHAFRHYHLTKLKDMGLDLDIIQDIAGHASVDTTKSIYASKVNQNRIIEAEKELQDLLDTP